MFLCVQRSHVKFTFGRFHRRAAGFYLQRADRHVCLCSDRRIACRSRERARVYAARCRFCGKCSRGHFIQLRFVLARQRRFASRSEFLDMERASGICHHTSHGRFGHFHRTAACQRCVFLCVQRSHVKFTFGRFDDCAAGFCLQRANRHICLRGDRCIACLRRERFRFHAARCRFCGKHSRSHVIQLRFVLARQLRFASRSELLDVERCSCFRCHTVHVCIRDVHRVATREFRVFLHTKRFRAKRSPCFHGQALCIRTFQRHSATACQRCVFLCIQRSHIKFAFGRFDRRVASFRLQRAERHICLRFDFRIACLSRERSRFHTAAGRDSKRARFCFGERDIVISLNCRAILRAESLDPEHAMRGDLRLSFYRDQGSIFERGPFSIGIGEIAAGGIGAVFDGSFIRDAHRPLRGVCAERQLAAVCDGHCSRFRGIAAMGERAGIGDAHRRAGHRCFACRTVSASVIRERAACGIGAVFDGSFIRDIHRSCRGIRPHSQLAAVRHSHRARFRGIAAVGERTGVDDIRRRAGHRCFACRTVSTSVIRERTACGIGAILDGSLIRDAERSRRGIRPRRQFAAVRHSESACICAIRAVFHVAGVLNGKRVAFCAPAFEAAAIVDGERTAGQRDVFHDAALADVIDRCRAARKGRILDGCGIRDGEGLCPACLSAAESCLIGQGGIFACEGAAGDGAVLRVVDVKCLSRLVAALRDLAVIGDGGIFRLDGGRIRRRFSKEGDISVTRRMETDAARQRTAIFGFCASHFHAEGLSFALALDICHVFEGNILPFDVRVGGAHFFIGIMAVFRIEAVALEVECHIAVGSIDGIDDEVAVFRKRDAFLCAGGEGTAILNGDAGNLTFAGLEDDLVLRAHSDILEIARPLHAEFAAGEEFAAFLHAGIAGEINGTVFCFRGEFPLRIRCNGADGADGDGLVVYLEIAALCGRESDQLVCRQALDLLFRREVDHLSAFLASDATHVLAIFHFAAKRCQGDILPRDMRGFFLRGLGIGDTLFDAAAGVGDEEILRGLRRADEDFCLFRRREVCIRCQTVRFERGIAIDLAVRAALDVIHIRLHLFLLPCADRCFQLVIARLFLCYICIDVSDAFLCQCRLRGVVQRVLAVFHIPLEGLILIVLALYLGNEEGLLF